MMPRADSPQQKRFPQIQDPESFWNCTKSIMFFRQCETAKWQPHLLILCQFLLDVETTAGKYELLLSNSLFGLGAVCYK